LSSSALDRSEIYDFAIIGAGIAGVSIAAHLAPEASLCVIEAESQAGYHATGRSAAMFVPAYGPPIIRMLTRASASFFHQPPEGFCEAPLLSARDILLIARDDQQASLRQFQTEMEDAQILNVIETDQLCQHQPLLRDGYALSGLIDPTGSDIDVHSLHRGFLRAMRHHGGELITSAPVQAVSRQNGVWHISVKGTVIKAHTIINAAGAWAEEIGQMAGAEMIGLVPKRRTALLIEPQTGLDLDKMPMTIDIDEAFYLKPEARQILISPANEDPMAPCDAQPDEMDIAICIDRIERAFDLPIRRIQSKWAGLRSFVADKEPVIGYSDKVEGFFWLAGQGGYGIQSSPAAGRLGAALALGSAVPEDIAASGFAAQMLHPSRLLLSSDKVSV